jgi:hypothetical protein
MEILVCDVCGKEYKTEKGLANHVLIHKEIDTDSVEPENITESVMEVISAPISTLVQLGSLPFGSKFKDPEGIYMYSHLLPADNSAIGIMLGKDLRFNQIINVGFKKFTKESMVEFLPTLSVADLK